MVAASIIVPVLNGRYYIRDCVVSLINQDFPKDKYEIIIVDNNSTDGTVDVIEECEGDVIILHEQKRGSYIARNKGIAVSRGKIIIFTDADCIASKDWLGHLCNSFAYDDIGCVVGSIRSYRGKTLTEVYSENNNILSQVRTLKHKFLPYGQTANVAYRKDVFDKIGYFDEGLSSGGDADIAWRMQLQTDYKLIYNPEAVVLHHHRTTLKNLFVQHFKYGIGSALLYEKYDITDNVTRSLFDWAKLAIVEGSESVKKLIRNHNGYYVIEPLLLLMCSTGYRVGILYGNMLLTKKYTKFSDRGRIDKR